MEGGEGVRGESRGRVGGGRGRSEGVREEGSGRGWGGGESE